MRDAGVRDVKPLVVVTHRAHDDALALLSPHATVLANRTGETLPAAVVRERCRDADAMLAFMPDRVDAAFLEACPRLRIVAGALRGYDNFDVAACTARGVWLTVVPDRLAGPTAELGVALLLALARRVPEGDAFVRSGRFVGWRPSLYGRGLADANVGILGMGRLGVAFARRVRGFDAHVVYHDVVRLSARDESELEVRSVAFEELLAMADYIAIALPLAPDTIRLVDAAALARMRPDAVVVNLSRASVVDEAAVAAALASGALGGYAADVFACEDWARDERPAGIDPSLLAERARTLFTPHLGSAVVAVRRAIECDAARSIVQALRGDVPEGAVNVAR